MYPSSCGVQRLRSSSLGNFLFSLAKQDQDWDDWAVCAGLDLLPSNICEGDVMRKHFPAMSYKYPVSLKTLVSNLFILFECKSPSLNHDITSLDRRRSAAGDRCVGVHHRPSHVGRHTGRRSIRQHIGAAPCAAAVHVLAFR